MRVAFVIPGALDQVSGGYLYDRCLVRELRALDVEVEVVSLPESQYVGALASNLGRVHWPAPPSGYDVIIEDELAHPALLRENRALRAAGVPVVALVHNLRSRQPRERAGTVKRAVERAYLRGIDGVIAVCASTLADVRELAGSEPPSVVAYAGRDHVEAEAGVDDAFVTARAGQPGPLRILSVAAVMPHKGLHRLLAALPGPSEGDSTLDVAGSLTADAGYVRDLRAQVHGGGLRDRVRFHGQLAGTGLWQLYRRAQVFALASDREAYSIACLDALGFGLPVITTRHGGSSEMIRDGIDGACLDPDNAPNWNRMLVDLARDRARLAVLGSQALRRHRGHGSWRDTAFKVRAFLQTLAQRFPRALNPSRAASRARTAPASAS